MSFGTRSLLAVAIGLLVSLPSYAAEPRPWLCRDKPVFSSAAALDYQATARPGARWQIFFMQFEPNGPHDGFSIVSSVDLPSHGTERDGTLAAGRYFAVPLYSRGGHWICPGYTRDDTATKHGSVAQLCYGQDEGECQVNLSVKESRPAGVEPVPRP